MVSNGEFFHQREDVEIVWQQIFFDFFLLRGICVRVAVFGVVI
jgi:hypothetical protein